MVAGYFFMAIEEETAALSCGHRVSLPFEISCFWRHCTHFTQKATFRLFCLAPFCLMLSCWIDLVCFLSPNAFLFFLSSLSLIPRQFFIRLPFLMLSLPVKRDFFFHTVTKCVLQWCSDCWVSVILCCLYCNNLKYIKMATVVNYNTLSDVELICIENHDLMKTCTESLFWHQQQNTNGHSFRLISIFNHTELQLFRCLEFRLTAGIEKYHLK